MILHSTVHSTAHYTSRSALQSALHSACITQCILKCIPVGRAHLELARHEAQLRRRRVEEVLALPARAPPRVGREGQQDVRVQIANLPSHGAYHGALHSAPRSALHSASHSALHGAVNSANSALHSAYTVEGGARAWAATVCPRARTARISPCRDRARPEKTRQVDPARRWGRGRRGAAAAAAAPVATAAAAAVAPR